MSTLMHNVSDVLKPVAVGTFGLVTVSQVKDLVAIAVGVITIICTILVTRHTLRKK